MPSADQHLNRARAHHLAAHRIAEAGELEWATVALFYSARDLVHTILAVDHTLIHEAMRHPRNHTRKDHHDPGTNFVVSRHYGAIDPQYRSLYGVSCGIRYEGQKVIETEWLEHQADHAEIRRRTRQYIEAENQTAPQWLTEA